MRLQSIESPVVGRPRLRSDVALVALLTLFALGVRLWGLDHLLPHRLEPDRQIAQQVLLFDLGLKGPMDEAVMTKYPWLLARLSSIGFEVEHAEDELSLVDVEEHRRRCAAVSLRVRLWVALFGALSIPLTWWLARKVSTPKAALLAAALLATSLLHHDFSQQARPHIPAATFVLLTVALAAHATESRGRASWVLACSAAALAMGSLQSGIAAFLPLAAAWWLTRRGAGWKHGLRLVVPLVAFVGAVYLFYPFMFGDLTGGGVASPTARFELEGTQLRHGTHTLDLSAFNGRGLKTLLRGIWMYDPMLFAGLAVGLGAWLLALFKKSSAHRSGSRVVVLAYALPYLLVIALYSRTFQRFGLPLLPFLAMFAAVGWCRVAALLGRDRAPWRRGLAVLGTLAILGLPAATNLRLSWLRSQPDTYERLIAWMEREHQFEEPRLLLLTSLELPPVIQEQSLVEEILTVEPDTHMRRVYWHNYQARIPAAVRPEPQWQIWYHAVSRDETRPDPSGDPLTLLRSLQADFLVESRAPWTGPRGTRRTLLSLVREMCPLVLRLAPDDTLLPLEYNEERQTGDWRPHHAWRIWTACCVGPVIDVYRLPQ